MNLFGVMEVSGSALKAERNSGDPHQPSHGGKWQSGAMAVSDTGRDAAHDPVS